MQAPATVAFQAPPIAQLRIAQGFLLIIATDFNSESLNRFRVLYVHGQAPPLARLWADQALQTFPHDTAAQQGVVRFYANRMGGLSGLTPEMMVARLRMDLRDGNFLAAFFIPNEDALRYGVMQTPDWGSLAVDPTGPVSKWSAAARIAAMLRRIPGYLPESMRAHVAALFSPKAVALLAVMLAALAVAQAYGVGEVVDAILVAAAWVAAGWAGLVALKDFIATIIDAGRAGGEADIDAAAKQAANALVTLGITFITAILLRAKDEENVGTLEKSGADEEGAAANAAKPKPAPSGGWKSYAASKGVDPADVLYRGDSRPPSQIFQEGFQPRGTATDLQSYAATNTPSNFVSLSQSENVATSFAQTNAANGNSYVYMVGPEADGINVNSALGDASPYPDEQEIAVRGGVTPQNILGAQQVGADGAPIGPFIPNPGFTKP